MISSAMFCPVRKGRNGSLAGCLTASVVLAGGCFGGGWGGGGGGGGGGTGIGDDGMDGDPAESLNAELVLPDEGETLEDPEVDESVEVMGSMTGMADVQPGDMVTVRIPFNAPDGNVVGAGIRFGPSGPVRTVQVPDAMGVNSGMLTFQFGVPASICDSLSSICHDIKCYEFAVTDIGRISQENITDIALACNNCDEPSCQELLDMCSECDGFRCDDGTCIDSSTACNGTDDCPDGSDEKASVCGEESSCCVATDGCPGETGSDCAESCCCCPVDQACCDDPTEGCCAAP